jgi:hypothetical protein
MSTTDVTLHGLNAITARVKHDVRRHSPRGDSLYYNGGTVLVLLLTSAATFLGAQSLGVYDFVVPLLSGTAAFLVGLERALDFGARWRYHANMRAGYEAILDQIEFLTAVDPVLTPEDRLAGCRQIRDALSVLRRQEAGLPGIGGAHQEGTT